MAQTSTPESRLNPIFSTATNSSFPPSDSSTGNASPAEPAGTASSRSVFSASQSLINLPNSSSSNVRLGAGSPLHEQGSRLFPRRTRELQAKDGIAGNIWGPPTSGNSTPLRETIPESPSQDGFPDLIPPADAGLGSPARRARAGTVPSRFSPVGTLNGVNLLPSSLSKTSRPTPSTSPFKPSSDLYADSTTRSPATTSSNAALLSRLRAGSMPQRSSFLGVTSPFAGSLFSNTWGQARERGSTLTSIRSADDPSSPSQSTFGRDSMTDTDVKTLDYLGLVETPQQGRATLARPVADTNYLAQQSRSSVPPQLLANFDYRTVNRFRSYSVNASEMYADEAEDQFGTSNGAYPTTASVSSAGTTAAQFSALKSQIDQHNRAVQEYAAHLSAARPRARTAGILDTPPPRSSARLLGLSASHLQTALENGTYVGDANPDQADLAASIQRLQLNTNLPSVDRELGTEQESQISRSLWIGSIPVSTTNTSLDAIFSRFGNIESTRVLSHKNCGFVNFENLESAMQARQSLNGKEIFPGAGPVRIGFAKAPSGSASGTPGLNTADLSPARELHQNDMRPASTSNVQNSASVMMNGKNNPRAASTPAPSVPHLQEIQPEMLQIVLQFGANADDVYMISSSIDSAIARPDYETEILPVMESNQPRMFDAPRLRDIRKRMDSGSCPLQEIEETANAMLPEIAELASDYLGNTVVQKLFEKCSEQTKEHMLGEIAPHLAEIGIHKNGTWAAQKIIDVCRTEAQMTMVANSLRPYTVPLFLDQYGNYVLQCCLRFGSPFSDFIFEAMLSQMWEIAQGRFGARAMRACLESHYATKNQQRMLASAIAVHGVQLATNTNGALLLTWFLDTCTFPSRRSVLAPHLVQHLVHLCTHKVAYLTVLKVINQRNEPEARDAILKSMFFSEGDSTLEQILSDHASGATLIFKVLTTPCFDETLRSEVVQNVADVLTRIRAQPGQGYRRLMDEVGLSSRMSHSGPHSAHGNSHSQLSNVERSRPAPHQVNSTFIPHQALERQYSGSYLPTMPSTTYENSSLARSGSADSTSFPPYGLNPQPTFPSMQPTAPTSISYATYLGGPPRPSSSFFPNMPLNGFGGYAASPNSMDAFRTLRPTGSPLPGAIQMSPMMNSSVFPPNNYNPAASHNLYGYPNPNFPPPQQVQMVQGVARRGRSRFD